MNIPRRQLEDDPHARAARPLSSIVKTEHGSVTGLPALYTAEEVATALRTTRKCIYEMARKHRIPGVVKIGRKMLFRRDRLVEWLRESSVPSLEE